MNTGNVGVSAMVNIILSFDSTKPQTLQFSILRDSLGVQAYALDFLLGSVPIKRCTARIAIFSRTTCISFAMQKKL